MVHECFKEWVARMTTLVECWNKLDGNVGELSSWVATKDSAAPEGGSEISIEKLESQLNTLKTMFAEKQKLVSDLDAYGPAAGNIPIPVFMLLFTFYLDIDYSEKRFKTRYLEFYHSIMHKYIPILDIYTTCISLILVKCLPR